MKKRDTYKHIKNILSMHDKKNNIIRFNNLCEEGVDLFNKNKKIKKKFIFEDESWCLITNELCVSETGKVIFILKK